MRHEDDEMCGARMDLECLDFNYISIITYSYDGNIMKKKNCIDLKIDLHSN